MKIPMNERRALVRNHARTYQRAGKEEKGQILEIFVKATGYNRVYAAWLLRGHGKRVWCGPGHVVEGDVRASVKRTRGKTYGAELVKPLERIWTCLDCMCGKRLAAALPATLRALERHRELDMTPEIRAKLERMSAATMDRLLTPARKKMELKHRGGTKPGSLIKAQVAVRTFADWNEKEPGFMEIDLVGHDGGSTHGDYVQTLDVTDVHTGWSEQRAVLNKAQVWVVEALGEIQKRLPFELRGVDSDNGSEFINAHLQRFCQQHAIVFTRSRPYRKNDTCYVEQKNYSIVRRTVGYSRLEGAEAVKALNALYETLSLRTNFFLTSLKLKKKERVGNKVRKSYEEAQTPYARVMASSQVSQKRKEQLRQQYEALNPMALNRQINELRKQVTGHCKRVEIAPTPPVPHVAACTLGTALSPPARSRASRTQTRKQKQSKGRKGGKVQIVSS